MNTVQDPDIVCLYRKIHINPEYLDVPSKMPFVESPLHIAASEGRTRLALEILRLEPSLGKKLNLDGLSPLHLAMDNGHTDTVRRLINHDPDLIRVPGREGITILHYAVEKEDIDLLINCLVQSPSSIHDLTVRDETVVHIAVRNKKLRAFMVLRGWLLRTDNEFVLRWKDEEGNTVMHLAALTNQSKVIKSLIRYANVNEKNLEGKTALDLLESVNVEAREILMRAGAKEGSSLVDDDIATSCENYLKSNYTTKDLVFRFGAYLEFGMSGNMRNAILVVVVLIATAAFQTILTPPFGISQIGDTIPVFRSIISVNNATTSTNATSTNFYIRTQRSATISIIFNTVSFGLAMGACLILTIDPLNLFLIPPLLFSSSYEALAYGIYINPLINLFLVPPLLFSASYGALAYGICPDTQAYSLPLVVVSMTILPFLILIPWKKIVAGRIYRGKRNDCDYDLDEMKFLIFRNIYLAPKNSASV